MAAEEFADGEIGRTPHWSVDFACEIVVEKQPCTLVREDDGGVGEVVAEFLYYMFGYCFEK